MACSKCRKRRQKIREVIQLTIRRISGSHSRLISLSRKIIGVHRAGSVLEHKFAQNEYATQKYLDVLERRTVELNRRLDFLESEVKRMDESGVFIAPGD